MLGPSCWNSLALRNKLSVKNYVNVKQPTCSWSVTWPTLLFWMWRWWALPLWLFVLHLCHNHKLSFTSYDLRKEVSVPFTWSCKSFYIKVGFILGCHSEVGHILQQPNSGLNISLKICQLVLLQTPLIVYPLLLWMTLTCFFFTHFHLSELMMGNLNDQNPHLKFGHFWNTYIIQRFVFCAWHKHKVLFKVFCKFQKLFKTKVDANSLFIRSLPFQWATITTEHPQHTLTSQL